MELESTGGEVRGSQSTFGARDDPGAVVPHNFSAVLEFSPDVREQLFIPSGNRSLNHD